jgi:hypothetical protein
MNDILLKNFYTTPRKGFNLSDQGGPFGLDIHFALEVDYCITEYDCDCIFETGTNAGDTTEFLAKQYPSKQIFSCEIDETYFKLAKERLSKYDNVTLFNESSEKSIENFTKEYGAKFNLPFFYLDAHWNDYWPIADELKNIDKGVICIGDFYLKRATLNEYGRAPVSYGNEYSVDDVIVLDSKVVLEAITPSTEIYVNNVENGDNYEFPCLQSLRRSGRSYFCKNIEEDKFKLKDFFLLEKVFMSN